MVEEGCHLVVRALRHVTQDVPEWAVGSCMIVVKIELVHMMVLSHIGCIVSISLGYHHHSILNHWRRRGRTRVILVCDRQCQVLLEDLTVAKLLLHKL